MTLEPVVSSAMDLISWPSMPLTWMASRMARVRADIWSSWDCVLSCGSVGELCSGYSATAEPSLPRSLSKMEMRTLNVPKSTPATTLTDVSPLCLFG